jgi:hypothetical protein
MRTEHRKPELVPLNANNVKTFFCNKLHIDITTYAAEKFCDHFGVSPVNERLRDALLFCIETMNENDEYGWKDDAVKMAKEAIKEAE